MGITACLVVYNEEEVIKRCLDSIKGIADEIIVVHDGPCSDDTLKICRRYTRKVFVRKRFGEAEPHRPFCLEKAKYDWILVIDADEFLSKELKSKIKSLVKDKDVDGYRFIHSAYHKGKRISFGPLSKVYRLVLFRKNKTSISGRLHEWYEVSGRIEDIDLVLEHKPIIGAFSYSAFVKKDRKWAKLQAEQMVKEGRAGRGALFYFSKSFAWFFLVFFYYLIFKGYFVNGVVGFKASFFLGLYNFYVNWYVFRIKFS